MLLLATKSKKSFSIYGKLLSGDYSPSVPWVGVAATLTAGTAYWWFTNNNQKPKCRINLKAQTKILEVYFLKKKSELFSIYYLKALRSYRN